MTPQEQQQYWYQQHLLSLQQRAKAHAQGQQQLKSTGTVKDAPEQRVKQEEGKAHATNRQSEAPSLKEPATPAPKEEDPLLSAAESKLNIEPPEDSEEDLRLQQLQVAAAQWQQHPHHRVGFQYQRIMQKHAQLQQILQQYQQIIQQPPHLQTMSVDMQLQHYETQQKQFQQLHKEWEREFQQWQDQLQTYPHKDQLQEYEKQWQTWQGQMKATQSHLQEKVNSLQNMKNQYPGSVTMPPPFASYTQTAQGSIPVMPPTLPPTTPPQVPPPLSSGSQIPNSSIPPTSSSQSPQPTETPRPALLPTPVSFAPKVSGLAATLPYHSQITSSIASSDQGNTQVHMAKQSGPFASVSSEQGSGELKTSTGTSPLTPTTSITTFTQDKPLRSGGLLPDPPRGPYFEGPRGPRFDGPRGRGFERFEGPRQRGPRFEGQHLEGPKPRYENQKSDGQSSSKWGTIPRGPASQFYTTPTTSQMHSTRPSGPQCRGPRPSFGQQQLQAESRTENKEPFTDAAGKQQMANRTQSTPIPIDTDAKNSGPVQPNEDLKKMQQEPPKSEVKEIISEPKKWTWSSQDPAQRAEESKPTTQPPPTQNQKLASVPSSSAILQSPVPSRTGETTIVTPSPVPGDKDLNSADNKLPVSDGTLGQDLPGSENRVKGTVMSEGNRGTGPSFPPLDRYHEDRWREERDRDLYDRDRRDRGELRIREYPERVDRWREKRNYPPERTDWERERLSERWYADEEERMQPLEDQLDLPIPPPRSSDMLEADSTMDTDQSLGGVMVLSQRQHEIILKAAQELKMLREQKEQMQKLKEFIPEPELPTHETSRSQTTTPRPGSYQVSSQHPSETSLESQPITSSPAVIIKPPVLFRQPTAVTRPTSTVTRSSASVSRPLSSSPTPIASSSQTPGLKPSLATVEQERWDEDSFHGLWDTNEDKGANLEYELCKSDSGLPPPASSSVHPSLLSSVSTSLSSVMPSISKPPLIQQTVDYGHGRDITTSKVEQIPYGERITLRPEPLPERQPFPKEHPGQRDRYNRERDREPYFERQGNSSIDHRDFKREREVHRDRSSGDYDRERFEKERHPREDRVPPTVPSRTQSYRDKKDHPSTRRGSFERPSYERKPDRSTYDHGPSMFGGDRRNYPEERMPISAPSVPRQPPPTPRVERKPESKNVDDILKLPGRDSRPERIVIIMRGLPGSGKTHVAKLIRDKEVDCGGPAPRVLSLDDYFITEVEKEERDPDTGKKVKKKVMEYEYEADMEETYRTSMFKTFKKTLDDGFFPFIILDAINDRVRHFEQFWSAAKTKGFEVYLAEMSADNQTCSKRNIHGRKLKEINRMSDHWETAPRHMMRLDIRSLLQDAAIEEVEMEDFDANIEDQKEENKKDAAEEEESELGYIPKSKWEMDTSEAKLGGYFLFL
ncbi:YLP motif-containing protein 1 [Alligator mississippiensis]|uniref:YLP motif-containing protein 1 n=1 Tax=Alligator mississippiensis TaxID=8496 RepID=A0A151NK69_ALLMI|nr:YLP motif-containing protein 1 [Alligator mississippiensis]